MAVSGPQRDRVEARAPCPQASLGLRRPDRACLPAAARLPAPPAGDPPRIRPEVAVRTPQPAGRGSRGRRRRLGDYVFRLYTVL